MGGTRLSVNRPDSKKQSSGWLGRLLRPSGGMATRISQENSSKEHSDRITSENARFQSSQHMRLRSDQEHQAEVGARIRSMRKNADFSSARVTLDSIAAIPIHPAMVNSSFEGLKICRPESPKGE